MHCGKTCYNPRVNNTTQNSPSKVCKSCMRLLPFNYFGVKLSSRDGHNSRCKDCRNFKRRESYKSHRADLDIFPLAQNNTNIVHGIMNQFKTQELLALDLIKFVRLTIRFEFNQVKHYECLNLRP